MKAKQILQTMGWFSAAPGSLTQMQCRFGSGNITDTVLETISPEVEKHVKIPLVLGYPGYSLPSTPGQRRRKHA